MRFLKRRQLGDPILRRRSQNLTLARIKSATTQGLIKDMFYTLRRTGGVGLAAVQVGRPLRLFVIDIHPTALRPRLRPVERKVVINPRVLKLGKKVVSGYEGCLSFLNFAKVPRHQDLVVEYDDSAGLRIVEHLRGLEARVFQHELDHLNGVIFVDRVKDTKSYISWGEYKKRVRKKA